MLRDIPNEMAVLLHNRSLRNWQCHLRCRTEHERYDRGTRANRRWWRRHVYWVRYASLAFYVRGKLTILSIALSTMSLVLRM